MVYTQHSQTYVQVWNLYGSYIYIYIYLKHAQYLYILACSKLPLLVLLICVALFRP